MVSDVHRTTDVGQGDVAWHNGSTLSNTIDRNDTERLPSTLGSGLAQEDTNPDIRPFLASEQSSAAPDIGEGDLPRSEFMRSPPVTEPGGPGVGVQIPNIIILGEAGVGKSSVINLIAGQKRAHISNDALGCTFQYQRHIITLNRMPFAFWDTTGLDEGSEGTVPAKLAESNLTELIHGLAHSGGIHLVIYCVRGTRLTRALKRNYDLFYTAVCRKNVPVALVVTGLEHQQGNMETWWEENKVALHRHGMWFNAHACVTTLDVDDAVIRVRQSDSQKRLRDLVTDYGGRRPWKIEASVISWVMFRDVLRGVSSIGKKVTRRVIIYDHTVPCQTQKRLLGVRQLEYELAYVDDPRTPVMSGKPAGALVFYTSPLLGTRMSPEDVDALRTFYDIAGKGSCPMIVVLRGCKDDQIAQRCWDAVACDSDVHAWPMAGEQAKLDTMIEKRCIEHVEVKISRLGRAYEAIIDFVAAMINWQDPLVL